MHELQEDRAGRLNRRHFLATAATGLAGALLGLPGVARRATAQAPDCAYLAQAWSDTVKAKLATRQHRLNHFLWHALRNSWANFDPAKRQAIKDLGWEPPRPSMIRPQWDQDAKLRPRWDIGPAGEDFLYYHREMITHVNGWLAAEGRPPLAAWSRLDVIPSPGSGCADEAVNAELVPVFDGPKWGIPHFLAIRVRELKSDAFFWSRMAWWDSQFKDRAYLRSITLGELGARLESTVHNQMHIRWSAPPTNGAKLRLEEDIDPRWDAPGYDTLFDEYSSHVHPLFFRLHSWVDNRIEDWAEAHADHVESFKTAHGFTWYRDKNGGSQWVQVPNPWMGGKDTSVPKMEAVHKAMIQPTPGVAAEEDVASDLILLKDVF